MIDDVVEHGSAPVTAVFGFAIFLGLLLVAAQLLLHLTTLSMVGTATFDAARRGAAEDGGGCVAATSRARSLLGPYGGRSDVTIGCTAGPDLLVVTVDGPSPARAFVGEATGQEGVGRVHRRAAVRLEGAGPLSAG